MLNAEKALLLCRYNFLNLFLQIPTMCINGSGEKGIPIVQKVLKRILTSGISLTNRDRRRLNPPPKAIAKIFEKRLDNINGTCTM